MGVVAMDQQKLGNAAGTTRLARRSLAVSLALLSILLLWFGLFIAGPWFLRNPPGPNNPSFAWYMLFKSFPLALFLAAFLLLVAAYKLWRRGKSHSADSASPSRGPREP